ncbi:putative metalloprotease CJM1_0395 family protein [Shewanella litorisediminis]|uniref:SprA-related family protein n=1 Tax=Shewanella litorisediminis TaxID=1173586 RepID=A0ABX7FYM1_9GAMM|nr:putative metalloprotease CJM1_0395 family protein [Shewanella litorisediminis]MCL2919276.1 hypothetical protein [Shewanella litorisediminis]QRH00133.1 hypothetical protein JQC75_09405 [Shewanella litorisediminis]
MGESLPLKSTPISATLPSVTEGIGQTKVKSAVAGLFDGDSALGADVAIGQFNLLTGAQSVGALPGVKPFAASEPRSSVYPGTQLSPPRGIGNPGTGDNHTANIFTATNQSAVDGVANRNSAGSSQISALNAVFDTGAADGSQSGKEEAFNTGIFGREDPKAINEARQQKLAEVFGGDAGSSVAKSAAGQTQEETNAQARARESANQRREQVKVRQQEMEVRQLEARQAEVLAHERAHAAVGGQFARAPSFDYELGPDGKRYATGGEVSIDISTVHGNPQATINKMQQVYAAAMAPVNPSQADLRVAAEALRKIELAKDELAAERRAAMPTRDELSPLLEAQNAIDEIPAFEPVTPSVGTNLDPSGALSKEEGNSGFVEALSARVKASLAQTLEGVNNTARSQSDLGDSDVNDAVVPNSGSVDNDAAAVSDGAGLVQNNSRTTDISKLGPPRAILAYLAANEKTQRENDKLQRQENNSSPLLALA